MLEQIQNLTIVSNALLLNANLWKNPCCATDFICTDNQRVQTNLFFSNLTYHTNYSY